MCPHPTDAAAKPGLRERKKLQTRRAIRAAAFRLFAEQGYDATPVDRIAEAADVSPSTVFRYFPSKEDIVLPDEHEELAAALRTRPVDERPLVSLRTVMHEALSRVLDDPVRREEMVQRGELVRDVPAVRARANEAMAATGRLLGEVIAERTGRPADDVEVRVFAAAVFTTVHETTMYWVENGRREDLLALLDRTLTIFNRGLEL